MPRIGRADRLRNKRDSPARRVRGWGYKFPIRIHDAGVWVRNGVEIRLQGGERSEGRETWRSGIVFLEICLVPWHRSHRPWREFNSIVVYLNRPPRRPLSATVGVETTDVIFTFSLLLRWLGRFCWRENCGMTYSKCSLVDWMQYCIVIKLLIYALLTTWIIDAVIHSNFLINKIFIEHITYETTS